MVGNCDKMVLISSTSNEWQQNNQVIDDEKTGCFNNNNTNNNNMSSAGTARVIMDQKLPAGISHEQQQQIHKQQNQEPLRCPRCDSSNTKFCYYNNYSLSQPRHFCKACKRYWTRGGTLRNVPVGGGCRKNKRVRRSSSSSTSACSSSSSLTNPSFNNNNDHHHLHLHGSNDFISNSPSNHVSHHSHNHPSLFYGLPSIHDHNLASDVNFPFTRYDLQNQPHNMNGLGLGFQSSSCGFGEGLGGGGGFHIPASKQIFQDLISSNPLLSHYATTTTTSTSTTPTISSLLANSLHLKASNNFHTMLPSYEHQDNNQLLKGNGDVNSSGGMFMKEVKMELEAQNRSSLQQQHHWSNSNQNQMDQTFVGSSSDPSLIWSSNGGGNNGNNNLGAWLDPSTNNIGSSVPSLI